MRKSLAIASAGFVLNWSPALSADLAVNAPVAKAVYDWTGFYVGGHFGYGGGTIGSDSNSLPLEGVLAPQSVTGLIGGYQMGYNRQLENHVVLGIEADASFTSPPDQAALGRMAPTGFNSTLDYIGTVRGRIGYAFGMWMPYVTGGLAWGHTHVLTNDGSGSIIGQYQAGWTAGLGVEFAVSGNWSAKFEYDYVDLSNHLYDLSAYGLPNANVEPRISLAKIGLNYHFGDMALKQTEQTALPESDVWNAHVQTTLLGQGYPAFHAPYDGPFSLPSGGQFQNTWSATAFLGVRLWDGTEFYFDPELNQGFGLNGTLGVAGFPNGEAQKAGAPFPKFRPERYYIKQTWGLGGEQEEVPDGPNQLAGKRDIDRVTLIVGRFAMGDFFDNNSYAHDPRVDFMNWSMWEAGAYDFPADLPGYTRGAILELNQQDWAIRGAVVEVPTQENSDILTFTHGEGVIVEFEERHTIFNQPGKLRLAAFENWGVSGNYRQALAIEAQDPTQDINAVMASILHVNPKYGFYVNLEQQVATDVGIFARASWNDGQNQILSYTDIDSSLSGGVSIKGSYWGRPDDTIGIGGVINGLSAAHRDFLAAGGLGLLIGDGQLNYRPEQTLEAYYSLRTSKWSTLTFDYQFVGNPSYNADRGPVSIFSARAHAEF